jgi:hypothetical protein
MKMVFILDLNPVNLVCVSGYELDRPDIEVWGKAFLFWMLGLREDFSLFSE